MTTNKQKRAEGPRCPACENEKNIYRGSPFLGTGVLIKWYMSEIPTIGFMEVIEKFDGGDG